MIRKNAFMIELLMLGMIKMSIQKQLQCKVLQFFEVGNDWYVCQWWMSGCLSATNVKINCGEKKKIERLLLLCLRF